jgi:hypothetical protein
VVPVAMEQDEHAFKPQWLMQGAVKAASTASIFAAPSSRAGELHCPCRFCFCFIVVDVMQFLARVARFDVI